MKYTIDTTRVSDEANRMNDIANSITNASDTLNGIIGANALCTDSGRMIMRSLMSVKKELDANAGKTKKYAGALSDIAALYGNAEKKAMGEASHKAKSKNKKNKSNNNLLRNAANAAVDFVGGIGPFGAVSGIAKDLVFHEGTDSLIEDVVAIPKDAYKVIKAVNKNHTAKAVWSDLLDLDTEKGKNALDLKNLKWNDKLKLIKQKALDDYCDADEDTSGVNWITPLVSAGVSNFIEHHGINTRMIDETRTEFGLAIGKDILVKAAISAAFTAFSLTPQGLVFNLVVAAGGIAFDMAGNAIARQVTGDPKAEWMECISDKVCDLMEDVRGKAADAVVKTTGSTVQWTGALAAV